MSHTVIRAHAAPWMQGIELSIRDETPGSRLRVACAITMEEIVEGACIMPTASISMQAAQILMDDLWSSGLRPTEGAGSAGSLRATEKHLADMRAIVSKKIGVEL